MRKSIGKVPASLLAAELAALATLAACAPAAPRATPAPSPPVPSPQAAVAPEHALDALPPELQAGVTRASAALDRLQQTLGKRLTDELARGGPAAAARVCSEEAVALTAQVGQETGVEVGRTSARLRSEANAPRPWARPFVARTAASRAADVKPVVVDLGDRVGVLRPIPVQPPCLLCHGEPATFDAGVRELLRARYPTDRAVGFAEGDVRGAFWAEAPKR